MKRIDTLSTLLLSILIIADGFVWYAIIQQPIPHYQIDFLDVGQGDSQLVTLGNVRIITDAGPNSAVLRSLAAALPDSERYVDLAIITHPEKDHYGGFSAILDHYSIGAILWTGFERSTSTDWNALRAKISELHIPFIVVGAGDTIVYSSSTVKILSPDPLLLSSGATNDTGIVQKVTTPDFTALLTADIGLSVEDYLVSQYTQGELNATILKVGHHGSKYSSREKFLGTVSPSIAVIQVGEGNTYGHPAPETLAHLKNSGISTILRTDMSGIISIQKTREGLQIRTTK